MEYFDLDHAITFEGADSRNPLAFRHYQADEVVLGRRFWRQCFSKKMEQRHLGGSHGSSTRKGRCRV